MSTDEKLTNIINNVFSKMPDFLDERQKRLLSGCIANGYGHGGIKVVSEASGLNPKTIRSGIAEIIGEKPIDSNDNSIRRSGAGRPGIEKKYPQIKEKIEEIKRREISRNNIHPEVLYQLNDYLSKKHPKIFFYAFVAKYLKIICQFFFQIRIKQFLFINDKAKEFLNLNDPVISVDTKKKELIGNFKNNGSEYRPIKNPRRVLDHDFPLEGGKVAPYGVYVINNNTAYVNLGTDHDTSAFAVESIRRWWNIIGKNTFPNAKRLYINCDGGGSNGWRVRLWKYELALLAEELCIEVHVSHFPPGTSKWNKVEHRLFCFITKNWAGKPLIDINTTVNLISSTKTEKGLTVQCEVDNNEYETGIKILDDELQRIDIEAIGPNTSWNYIIRGFKKSN